MFKIQVFWQHFNCLCQTTHGPVLKYKVHRMDHILFQLAQMAMNGYC